MHIKYLEKRIDEYIAKVEARAGYKTPEKVRAPETEQEVWKMLREYKAYKAPMEAAGLSGTVATR